MKPNTHMAAPWACGSPCSCCAPRLPQLHVPAIAACPRACPASARLLLGRPRLSAGHGGSTEGGAGHTAVRRKVMARRCSESWIWLIVARSASCVVRSCSPQRRCSTLAGHLREMIKGTGPGRAASTSAFERSSHPAKHCAITSGSGRDSLSGSGDRLKAGPSRLSVCTARDHSEVKQNPSLRSLLAAGNKHLITGTADSNQ